MGFVVYDRQQRHGRSKPVLNLTPNFLSVGIPIGEQMGWPSALAVHYDKAAKQIKLVPEGEDTSSHAYRAHWKRGDQPSAARLAVSRLSEDMPLGLYLPIGSDVFMHESLMR